MFPIKTPKKLIEVALPLDDINIAAAREKSIRHGHPSTLHLWWARRPLAAARAVIFAQMVNDPGYERSLGRGVNKEKARIERERLFGIIRKLVLWENTNNEEVLAEARAEIWKSWRETCDLNRGHPQAAELFNPDKLPAFHDPFAGGGSLPLEAQRLGLESYASDLNPVAVLINKAMIEIPPRFAGRTPVGPIPASQKQTKMMQDWSGAKGLAEDVRRYGAWMREEAFKRIGHLYPQVDLPKEYGGGKAKVIAWLWARTVKSPNPAFSDVDVPLASTFILARKPGKEAYVEPVIEGHGYRFTVKSGEPPIAAKSGTKLSRGANFKCLMSGTPMAGNYIKAEGMAGRMGARLMAVVAEGQRGRIYLAPTPETDAIALTAEPEWKPEINMPIDRRWFSPPLYGMPSYGDIFTHRQLIALTIFSDLVQEARAKIKTDAIAAWERGAGVPPANHQGKQDPPGWHRRGDKHPPHYDVPNLTQFVTFRLADTLPQEKLKQWKDDLATHRISDEQYRQQAEDWLDRGMGTCWLKDPRIATVVRDALRHFDGVRYMLHGWVIMPNHVHVVFSPCEPHRLADILHSWKSYTAKQANQILKRSGPFWQDDYFDRFIRNESDLNHTLTYLMYNPVVAGLSATPEQYPFVGLYLNDEGHGGRASRPSEIRQQQENDGRDARPPSEWGDDGRDARPPILADEQSLDEGGAGATAYSDAVAIYLGMSVDKAADYNSSLVAWSPTRDQLKTTFGRQALPMVWDFAETNPFAGAAGDIEISVQGIARAMASLPALRVGFVAQSDAQSQVISKNKVISTDPPYYDNIGYADLSDFFYVWLRRALRPVYPSLFATMTVPKAEELVATPYRHGSKEKAEAFFLDGMTDAMRRLAEQSHPAFPTTIYYAFKQSGTTDVGTGNTGWETFLEATLRAGFAITGTWPMRTEREARSIGIGTNALASSIILVCQQRSLSAPATSRREFLRELKEELTDAVETMIGGAIGISPVAPVDLAQAVIGPGMATFSKYSAVLEADGTPMTVHTALMLINRLLTEGGDDFDSDTQFCLGWFDEQGWSAGEFGKADVLARAKGTSVDRIDAAGVVEAGAGRVRLLKPIEYSADWSPETDKNTPVWEALHQMIRALQSQSASAAGALLARMPERAEPIRNLAYRLYTLCERKGWAEEARSYNELITSWVGIEAASHETGHLHSQATMDV